MTDLTATAETDIEASPTQVWRALTEPEQIRKYMFGSQVETDWQPGSPIRWMGEYDGKAYEDKGKILEIEPDRLLKVTHYSPMSGLADRPENYHTLTYELRQLGDRTRVSLSQDNNPDVEAAEHSKSNWAMMLSGLKKVVEGS